MSPHVTSRCCSGTLFGQITVSTMPPKQGRSRKLADRRAQLAAEVEKLAEAVVSDQAYEGGMRADDMFDMIDADGGLPLLPISSAQ